MDNKKTLEMNFLPKNRPKELVVRLVNVPIAKSQDDTEDPDEFRKLSRGQGQGPCRN